MKISLPSRSATHVLKVQSQSKSRERGRERERRCTGKDNTDSISPSALFFWDVARRVNQHNVKLAGRTDEGKVFNPIGRSSVPTPWRSIMTRRVCVCVCGKVVRFEFDSVIGSNESRISSFPLGPVSSLGGSNIPFNHCQHSRLCLT